MTRKTIARALNVFIVVFTLVALFMTVTGWANDFESDAHLVTKGWANLKYFTVLSNLLSGVAAALYLATSLKSGKEGVPRGVASLKLAATTSVALTFLTVVVLFWLVWGLSGMFGGANLFYHMLLPLAAMASMLFFETDIRLRLPDAFLATIPMVLYGIGYYANILINGVGTPPNGNDWYGFASAGLQWAPVVFVGMFVGTLLVALILYAIHKAACERTL